MDKGLALLVQSSPATEFLNTGWNSGKAWAFIPSTYNSSNRNTASLGRSYLKNIRETHYRAERAYWISRCTEIKCRMVPAANAYMQKLYCSKNLLVATFSCSSYTEMALWMSAIEIKCDVKLPEADNTQSDASCSGFTVSSSNLSRFLNHLHPTLAPSGRSLLTVVWPELRLVPAPLPQTFCVICILGTYTNTLQKQKFMWALWNLIQPLKQEPLLLLPTFHQEILCHVQLYQQRYRSCACAQFPISLLEIYACIQRGEWPSRNVLTIRTMKHCASDC